MSDEDSPGKKTCTSSHTRTAVVTPAALLRRAVQFFGFLTTFLSDNLVVHNHTSSTQEVEEEEVPYCTYTAFMALIRAVGEACVDKQHTHIAEVNLSAARLEYQDALANYNKSVAALEEVNEDGEEYNARQSEHDNLSKVYNTARAALDEADKQHQIVSPKLQNLRVLKNKADETRADTKNARSGTGNASKKAKGDRTPAMDAYTRYREKEFKEEDFTSTPNTLWTCFAKKYNTRIEKVNRGIETPDERYYVIPPECVNTPTKECLHVFKELFTRSFTQTQSITSDCFAFLNKTAPGEKRKRSDNDDRVSKRCRDNSLKATNLEIENFAAELLEKIQDAILSK
jgi:hypothetical protein